MGSETAPTPLTAEVAGVQAALLEAFGGSDDSVWSDWTAIVDWIDAGRREQAGLREAAAALVVEWDRSVPVLSDMTTVVRLQTGQLTGEAASVMRLRDSVDALRAALASTPESGTYVHDPGCPQPPPEDAGWE